MLDYRIYTFLQLCDTMNYRETAGIMNMTQPAVTQHIQYLEREYVCRLFVYDGKKLEKTREGRLLESYARSENYNNQVLRSRMNQPKINKLRIGATKTIGDYVINDKILEIAANPEYDLSLVVDNTKNLLTLLEHNELDLTLIEGFFDKEKYGHRLFRNEKFVGVCKDGHPFAGQCIPLDTLFSETIIIREEGSGTRAIFEQILYSYNYSLENFNRSICLSSFKLIEDCILNNMGITFAYESFARKSPGLDLFTIDKGEFAREFNFVYLKNTEVDHVIDVMV